jgi:ABC-type ATPase involved in cell division
LQQIKQTNRTVIIASDDVDFVSKLNPQQMIVESGQLSFVKNKTRAA